MRVVLDTVVMVAAIRCDRGASRLLLVSALARRFTLLASVPLMIEYQAVMTRAEHLTASGPDERDVEAPLDAVASVVEPVRLHFLWRPVTPDPDDDMVLETAVNGGAELVASFNARHLVRAAARFGIEVVPPAVAVRRLELVT